MWSSPFPSQTAYRAALYRLRKAGTLVRPTRHEGCLLQVSPHHVPKDALRPERLWKEKWSGIWNVLVYDVPEKQRAFRDSLRPFLYRLRMGCLQKSVWISPRDIRPVYDDLVKTIGLDFHSFLFEARTVLRRSPQDIVLSAWNFNRLQSQQSWFIETCSQNIDLVRSQVLSRKSLETLVREEMTAYLSVMQDDPLLPHNLLPPDYMGRAAFDCHRAFVATAAKALHLSSYPPIKAVPRSARRSQCSLAHKTAGL